MGMHGFGKAALASVLVVACTTDTDGFGGGAMSVGSVGDGGETGDGGGGEGKTGGGSGVDDGGGEAPDDSDGGLDDGVLFDLPPGEPGEGGDPEMGCSKVDFLFVVDNSVSMEGQQADLVAAFPGFIAAIEAALPANADPHVMVVDTDAETRCTHDACHDDTPSNKVQELCLDPAGGYACEADFSGCDRKLGAGVVHPAGAYASNQPCAVAGGKRWLDDTDADIAGSFSCMAKVGTAGDPAERPMDAMREALGYQADHCNAGFLRDDAILVVTFISDDQCYEDAGAPPAWAADVIAAKHGDPSAVVVLGIVPGNGCHDSAEALASCDTQGVAGAHWREFVDMFEHGSTANVCDGSYVDFFAQAVAIVQESCSSFEPPG
ncbi:MAG TPA: hypothetical protein VFG69_10885 [Nannocystaceae bacterium]|nr:hypothetical protein [Nannocystaceae bacterium]